MWVQNDTGNYCNEADRTSLTRVYAFFFYVFLSSSFLPICPSLGLAYAHIVNHIHIRSSHDKFKHGYSNVNLRAPFLDCHFSWWTVAVPNRSTEFRTVTLQQRSTCLFYPVNPLDRVISLVACTHTVHTRTTCKWHFWWVHLFVCCCCWLLCCFFFLFLARTTAHGR